MGLRESEGETARHEGMPRLVTADQKGTEQYFAQPNWETVKLAENPAWLKQHGRREVSVRCFGAWVIQAAVARDVVGGWNRWRSYSAAAVGDDLLPCSRCRQTPTISLLGASSQPLCAPSACDCVNRDTGLSALPVPCRPMPLGRGPRSTPYRGSSSECHQKGTTPHSYRDAPVTACARRTVRRSTSVVQSGAEAAVIGMADPLPR